MSVSNFFKIEKFSGFFYKLEHFQLEKLHKKIKMFQKQGSFTNESQVSTLAIGFFRVLLQMVIKFEPKNAYPFIRYIGGWSPSKSDFLEIIWLLVGRQQFVGLSLLGAV